MKTNYTDLINNLKKECEKESLSNIEIYCGDINGVYDTEYDINQKTILDVLTSDGNIIPNPINKNISYEIDNANYVYIKRYKNVSGENGHSKLDKIILFIDEQKFQKFFIELVCADIDLYLKIYENGDFKGNITNYKDDERTGLKVIPSADLLRKNEEKTQTRKR